MNQGTSLKGRAMSYPLQCPTHCISGETEAQGKIGIVPQSHNQGMLELGLAPS